MHTLLFFRWNQPQNQASDKQTSLEQQQKWGDLKRAPKPPKHQIAGLSWRGNPNGTIGRKTAHFDIFQQTATNLPEFFRPCCVCSPRFKLCLYARALFVHVFHWRSVGQASVTQALLWLVHQQSRSFQGLPSFEDWDTKFGQIESSQGPHIQGYILLKMYKN